MTAEKLLLLGGVAFVGYKLLARPPQQTYAVRVPSPQSPVNQAMASFATASNYAAAFAQGFSQLFSATGSSRQAPSQQTSSTVAVDGGNIFDAATKTFLGQTSEQQTSPWSSSFF